MNAARPTVLNARHVLLVTLNTLRFALRSGTGVIFVVIVFYFGLAPCAGFLTVLEKAEDYTEERGQRIVKERFLDSMQEMLSDNREYINRFLGGGDSPTDPSEAEIERYRAADRWRSFMFDEQPLILTVITAFLVYLLPLFMCTGTFNVFASELQNHELRFELLRMTRASMYLGRYLGIAAFSVLVVATVYAIVVFYLGMSAEFYDWDELIGWALRGATALVFLTFPYVAVCQMVSAWCSSPFPALLLSYGIMVLTPTFAMVGYAVWDPMLYLILALPMGYHHFFFHPSLGVVALTCAGGLAHAVLYLGIGYRYFARRDL